MFVPAVTGAFLMIRRQEFLTLKFDERFKVAGEDIVLNLAYRAKFKRGVLYCADATAVHYENVTRKETDER
jgi:GT2 family glycosyltransferase